MASGRHVTINLQPSKDNSEFTVLDFATVDNTNTEAASNSKGRLEINLLHTAGRRINSINNNSSEMKSNNDNRNNVGKDVCSSPKSTTTGELVEKGNSSSATRIVPCSRPYRAGEEIELAEIPSAGPCGPGIPTIQRFAGEVETEHSQKGSGVPASSLSRLPSATPRSPSAERSYGKSSVSESGRVQSGEDVGKNSPCEADMPKEGSLGSEDQVEDLDLDLDLSSLRDLMATMRAAALEIREIVEPAHSESPSRQDHPTVNNGTSSPMRPWREHRRRRRKGKGQRRNSGHQRQIQAEIHVMSEVPPPPPSPATPMKERRASPPSCPTSPLPPSSPTSLPPSSPPPTAVLHVENEELSLTWPRLKRRGVSMERSLSDSCSRPRTKSEGTKPRQETSIANSDTVRNTPTPPMAARGSLDRSVLQKGPDRQHSYPSSPACHRISAARVPMETRPKVMGSVSDPGVTPHWRSPTVPHCSLPLPTIFVSDHGERPDLTHRDDVAVHMGAVQDTEGGCAETETML